MNELKQIYQHYKKLRQSATLKSKLKNIEIGDIVITRRGKEIEVKSLNKEGGSSWYPIVINDHTFTEEGLYYRSTEHEIDIVDIIYKKTKPQK